MSNYEKITLNTWQYANTTVTGCIAGSEWLTRGYTGHEHIDEFGIINMNARMYDPLLGRMLSPDKYVQDATSIQNFKRYTYELNNPLKYTDPDGEMAFLAAAAAIYFVFFTETGYDLQKFVSPVALHVDVNLGTHKRGIGIDASVGVPQMFLASARVHGGISYNWKNYDVTPGWETRYGAEVGLTPFATVGFTHYNSPGDKFDQTLGHVRLGVPDLNVKYANDWFFGLPISDNGDRNRTAAAKIQIGSLDIGINLFTGDPGRDGDKEMVDGNLTYVYNPDTDKDPDEYRAGVGYIGLFGFRFGNDRESRRHNIQNLMIHKNIGSPYFKVLVRPNKWYFQFGGGGGIW